MQSVHMPHHLSLLKTILKNQENHLIPYHISLLKNNSKNSRKSPHRMSHFSIEK
jgi:hypothetical protein